MVKRKGKLSGDRAELECIPFTGQYIANVVELIIYKQPSPQIEVSMSRLFERYFGKRKMVDIRYDPYLQRLSFKIVSHQSPKQINRAILDYAALVFKAQKRLRTICGLRSNRLYFNRLND